MNYPLSRKTTIITGAILVVIIMIGFLASRGQAKEIYITDTVRRVDVVKTVDVTGSLAPLSKADLSFQSSGNVASVNVKVGDYVRRGQVLATLTAADLSADARRAQAELNRELAGTRSEDLAVAQADVDSAEVNVRVALQAITLVQASNASAIELAEDALLIAQQDNVQIVQTDSREITDAVQNGLVTVRASLSKADELLGLENTLFGNEFEREFGALNPQTVQQAREYFSRAVIDRNLAESSGSTTVTLRALDETASTLLYTRQALDATSADSVDLSLPEIIAYKAGIDAARTNVEAARAALKRVLDAQSNNSESLSHAVRTAELKLADAKTTANRETQRAAADLETSQASVRKAKAAYAKLAAGPRAVDLAPYRASVDAAWARYQKAVITSPIEGRVGKVNLHIGESAQPGVAVISVVPSKPSFEVVINVPESDVAHLSLGDAATITFDAFGADTEFEGSLTSLDLTEKIIESVVFFEARIAVTEGARLADLRSGLSADVTISTDKKPNTLAVPTRAVLEKNGQKFVRVLVNDELVERDVVVGLRGDGGVTEILTGLKEGDTVVISIKK